MTRLNRRGPGILFVLVSALALVAGVLVAGEFDAAAAPGASACTIYWSGGISNDWSDPDNWSLTDGGAASARVPTSTDRVCVASDPVRPTALLSVPVTIGSLDWTSAGGDAATLTITGGLRFASSGVASDVYRLILSRGTIGGPGTLTVTGPGQFGAGSLGGQLTLITAGATTWGRPGNGSQAITLGGGLNWRNSGTATIAAATAVVGQGDPGHPVTVTNEPDGAIIASGAAPRNVGLFVDVFVNHGTVGIGPGTGTAAPGNEGFEVDADLAATQDGRIDVPGASSMQLAGPWTWTASATFTGTGRLDDDGATTPAAAVPFQPHLDLTAVLTLAASQTFVNSELGAGGAVFGPHTLTLAGKSAVIGFGIVGPNTTLVTPAHTATQIYDGDVLGPWRNDGPATLVDDVNQDGSARGTAVNEPGASMALAHDAHARFASLGNDGTVQVDAASALRVNTFRQGSDGSYELPVAGPGIGHLLVVGTASIDGALALQVEPGYRPQIGTVYTVINAGRLTGTFATVTGTDLGDRHLQVGYTGTAVTLTVVAN